MGWSAPRIAGLWLLFCSFSLLAAASVWDGIFTSEQAARGGARYRKACASCHGDALDGKGTAPPLTGADFQGNWNGQTLGDLFDKIQTSMPADDPGSLKAAENADILAFVLKANAFPAGQAELSGDGDTLKKIRFDAAKPAK